MIAEVNLAAMLIVGMIALVGVIIGVAFALLLEQVCVQILWDQINVYVRKVCARLFTNHSVSRISNLLLGVESYLDGAVGGLTEFLVRCPNQLHNGVRVELES